MKKLLLLLLLLPALVVAQSPPSNQNDVVRIDPSPVFQFNEESWDFGTIQQGIPVTHTFEFINSGKQPMVISQVTASCGCTTPVWTKEAVNENGKGMVAVTYNSAREGSFVKTVTILSNAGEPKYLTVKGNVVPKKNIPRSKQN
jgi:hypothetical protein